MNNRLFFCGLAVWILLGASGCATYTTPGGPVDLTAVQSADIRELMSRDAAATFPATISFARVQSSGYRSLTAETYGEGQYVVVTSRELMTDASLEEIARWQDVRAVVPLNRLLIPARLGSVDDLRTASARLKADVLIVFTMDTSFRVDGKSIGPLSVISLGLMRDRETVVNTTASAVFVDVRTGFVYGVAEATAREKQTTNAWKSVNVADQGRLHTEREAFDGLLRELESTWTSIVEEHRRDNAASGQGNVDPAPIERSAFPSIVRVTKVGSTAPNATLYYAERPDHGWFNYAKDANEWVFDGLPGRS